MLAAERTGIVFVILSAFGLAFKGTLAKFAYAAGVQVMPLLVWRFGLALPLFWMLYFLRGQHRAAPLTSSEWAGMLLAAFLGYYLSPIFDFEALARIDVSLERVLLFTYPAFVMLLEAVLTRRLPPVRQWIALFIVQTGILFVLFEERHAWGVEGTGIVLALCAALVYGGYISVNQRVGKQLGSIRFTVLITTAAFAMVIAHSLINSPLTALVLTPDAVWPIAAMAVGCTFLPLLLFSEGVQRIGGARAALISTVGPVITMVVAYMLLHERMTPAQIAGAMLVILGVLVLEGQVPAFLKALPAVPE